MFLMEYAGLLIGFSFAGFAIAYVHDARYQRKQISPGDISWGLHMNDLNERG